MSNSETHKPEFTFIPVDHLRPYLTHAMRSSKVLALMGDYGIGKTTEVFATAQDAGRKVSVQILSAMGTEDIAMAGPKPGGNFINFMANEGWPFKGTEERWLNNNLPPILFLDEINRTMPYMQNPMLQALGERSIHGIPFIDGTTIILAGNISDQHLHKLSAAFANRCTHLHVGPPTVDGFEAFCTKHAVNPWVPAYIKEHSEHLYSFNPDNFLIELAFPTPRTWARNVAQTLDDTSLDDSQRITLLQGDIGQGVAADFEVFYRTRSHMPDIDQILTTGKGKIPQHVTVKLVTVSTLVRRVSPQTLGNVFSYISILASTDPEWADLFEKNLFLRHPQFAGHPAYAKWTLQNNRTPLTVKGSTITKAYAQVDPSEIEEPGESESSQPAAVQPPPPTAPIFNIPTINPINPVLPIPTKRRI